ncbi:hypothetical protein BDA96_08G089900 [Sorghum bicolor]|uniref:Uncharacterized protein n=1 Tax=Sorghum bicolor TaxID=4558 RepID=A0A921QF06_SORBI|nr:hypothetical protein BDA96_08G089900 [Sorghum bicolor]
MPCWPFLGNRVGGSKFCLWALYIPLVALFFVFHVCFYFTDMSRACFFPL